MKKNHKLLLGIVALLGVAIGCGYLMVTHISAGRNEMDSGLPALRREEVSFDEKEPMKPSPVHLEGVYGGYMFVPIGDEVYRYQSFSIPRGKETEDVLLFTCVEATDTENYGWELYSLKEYPDYRMILGKCAGYDDILFEYAPEMKCEESAIEDAVRNGFVMMKNGNISSGKEDFLAFYEKTLQGKPCRIRIGFSYEQDTEHTSEDLQAATNMDYPQLYLNELTYDGEKYIISPVNKARDEYVICEKPGVDSPESSFLYLMHFTGTPRAPGSLVASYDYYVLLNREDVTWEDIESSMLSSQAGAMIHHMMVYSEYRYK